jgi:hypothetical protein
MVVCQWPSEKQSYSSSKISQRLSRRVEMRAQWGRGKVPFSCARRFEWSCRPPLTRPSRLNLMNPLGGISPRVLLPSTVLFFLPFGWSARWNRLLFCRSLGFALRANIQ